MHYFPPGLPDIPWRSADVIAQQVDLVRREPRLAVDDREGAVGHDRHEAVIEWTHWKRKQGTAQRGDEWYVFDERRGLIREIRAYYAAPAVKDSPIGELVEFDYKGRGYHLTHK